MSNPQQQYPGQPPNGQGYPPQQQYPPYAQGQQGPPQGYPPQGYPPQQQGPPQQQYGQAPGMTPGDYVAQVYPVQGQFPPQGQYQGYPSQQGQYPPQQAQYPPQQGQYPPQQVQYHSQGQYPPQNGQFQGQNPQFGNQYPPNPYPGQFNQTGNYGPPAVYGPPPPTFMTPQVASQFDLLSAQQVSLDVEGLRKAMKGLGTDEAALIAILGKRSPRQMEQIRQAFKASYGHDLAHQLISETSGNFGKLCFGLSMSLAEFSAESVKAAIKALIEILAGRTNAEIFAIKNAYRQMYGADMEKEVGDDLSGHLKRLFVGMIQGQRDETGQVMDVQRDVEEIYKAGEGKWGTDESTFIMILNTRSYAHLRALFAAYVQTKGKTMEKVIKAEFSGDMERTLLSLVRSVENHPSHLAQQFEKSMVGLGTNDSMLIRLTVLYREPNMMRDIKSAYLTLFKKTLSSRIEGDTSGDYRKLLHAVVGV